MKKMILIIVAMILGVTSMNLQIKAKANGLDMTLKATTDKIEIDIENISSSGTLVRFYPNEYHSSEAFLKNYDGIGDDNKKDGYSQDNNYYDTNAGGTIEKENVKANSKIIIERFKDGYDKAYDKFYIIKNGNKNGGKLFGGEVVVDAKYITSLPSKSNAKRVEKTSIKGLEVFNVDDAEELGVSHSAITVDLNRVLSTELAKNTIEFESNGKKYYFNKSVIEDYDRRIISMTNANFEVTLVMIFWGHIVNQAPKDLIHPQFQIWQEGGLGIASPNLTTEKTIKMWQAIFEFFGDRYLREDEKYGKASNVIVGNELDSGYIWNNMGMQPLDEYIRHYERGLRIAHTALKKYWSNVNVLMSLDNYWNSDSASEFGLPQYVDKGGYKGKDILIELNKLTKNQGDYYWQVAFHPYGLDLRTPIFWDKQTVDKSPLNEYAERLTPINIEILPQFLNKDAMLFDGKMRDFYFTEQGYSSPHEDNYTNYNNETYDPENMNSVWLDRQIAAYCYAHYKFQTIGAKANIFHRQFDVQSEGLNIGLWTRHKDSDFEPYGKKPIWEIFKYIDTEKSLQFTTPYLKYLKIYPENKEPTSWSEIITGFDENKIINRKAPIEMTSSIISKIDNNKKVWNFEDNSLNGWEMADKATSIQIFNKKDYASEGNRFLIVSFDSPSQSGGGIAHKGIVNYFDTPQDFSKFEKFNFAIKVPKINEDNINYFVNVRFYSGGEVLDSSIAIEPDKYQNISVNLANSNFAKLNSVEQIKIWYSSSSHNKVGGNIFIDNIGFSGKNDTKKGCGLIKNDTTMMIGLNLMMTFGLLIILNKRRKIDNV